VATPYKELYDGVLAKLRSAGIPDVTEDELDEILFDYVKPACVKFKACRQDLRNRDDTLGFFELDLTDDETEILINFMYIEFLSANYINVPSLLRQSLVSRDYHAFSSANHLTGLMNLRNTIKKETRQMISVYSVEHSELLGKLRQIKGEQAVEAGGNAGNGDS
jgi:hypothetical protein